ncbi:MAG: right-handed parallel beta-helix repeat-containing protein [Candidatus Heimdallarchaeota archaeon]|nr:MAG: right-handed parallel beta-helix repeat-containing protein [Candidatus Heimdallarchaeota archaeon]
MIQCPHCGNELEVETAKFCTNCGVNLTKSVHIQTPVTQPITQKRGVARLSPSYRPWLIIVGSIVIIGVVFISIIFVGSYFLSSLFGPPLGSGIEIYSDTDFLEYSSSGKGTLEDPYILSNYYLIDEFIGFTIQNTTKHFIITDCTIDMCYEGIHLENVAPGTANIWGNTIFRQNCWVWETGPHAGITIYSSPGVNVSNNIIFNAGSEGILIEGSEECFIANNKISKQYIGIFVEYSDSIVIHNNTLKACDEAISCIDSNFTNITGNNCKNNYYTAINIIHSDFVQISNNYCFNTSYSWASWFSSGITLDVSSNCTVKNCTIIDSYQGIYASSTSDCQIYYNRFEDNSEYGVVITGGWIEGQSNTIFLNSFINNNFDGTSQASDNGTSNLWYYPDLAQGNYWSDWNGTGSYSIAGTANAVDIYPLSEPPV